MGHVALGPVKQGAKMSARFCGVYMICIYVCA